MTCAWITTQVLGRILGDLKTLIVILTYMLVTTTLQPPSIELIVLALTILPREAHGPHKGWCPGNIYDPLTMDITTGQFRPYTHVTRLLRGSRCLGRIVIMSDLSALQGPSTIHGTRDPDGQRESEPADCDTSLVKRRLPSQVQKISNTHIKSR